MVSVQKGVYDAYVTSQAGIINDLKKRLSELETKYADLLVNNQNLTKRVEELEKNEKNNSNGKKLFSDLFNKNKSDNEETNIINAIRIEKKQEERKAKNVIIFGTNYSEDVNQDKKIVDEIATSIGFELSNVKFVKRFKRKNNEVESTPILVELGDIEQKMEMLKLAKNLKNNENFSRVYISPDLTFAERELNKTLVAKRKDLNNNNDSTTSGFRYGIRNYDIVKIKINSNNPTL